MVYVRGVKLIFTGGHMSLADAFKGPNVILGLYECNYSLTVKQESSALPPDRNKVLGQVNQGGGPDSACGPCVCHLWSRYLTWYYWDIYLFISPLVRIYFQTEKVLGRGHKAEITWPLQTNRAEVPRGANEGEGNLQQRPRGKPAESRVVVVNRK